MPIVRSKVGAVQVDAALCILVACELLERGDKAAGLTELAHAVEMTPGVADLIKYEDSIKRGEDPLIYLRRFIIADQEFIDWDKSTNDASNIDN